MFLPPATLALFEAMETGASGTSSVSLIVAPTGVEGDTTRPMSPMQVCSSDEVFLASRGNHGSDVLERAYPLPTVPTKRASAVSSSSHDASAVVALKNSGIRVNSPINGRLAQSPYPITSNIPFTPEFLATYLFLDSNDSPQMILDSTFITFMFFHLKRLLFFIR